MPVALRIVNNFVHDLATGFWLAVVIVEAALRRELSASGLLAPGRPVLALCFWSAVGSLVVILATGVVRTATYRDHQNPNAELKRRLLVAKHVLLGAAFTLGTAWAHRLAFA